MKRVSFSEEMTTFRAVISIDNMTKNEREAVWVTPQEVLQSQQNIIATVFSMRQESGGHAVAETKSIHHHDSSTCVRGLEHLYSPSLTRQLKASKGMLINAVLDEQKAQEQLQERNGYSRTSLDHDAIARVSSTLSQGARDRAVMLGASDADYVRKTRQNRLELSGLCVTSKSA
jgi:hypothetical protein